MNKNYFVPHLRICLSGIRADSVMVLSYSISGVVLSICPQGSALCIVQGRRATKAALLTIELRKTDVYIRTPIVVVYGKKRRFS